MDKSNDSQRIWTQQARCFLLAAALAGSAVALGAFQAHGLQGFLERSGLTSDVVAKRLGQFEVGVRYHFYHALALAAFAPLPLIFWTRPFRLAVSLLAVGTVIFSGSLYLLVLLNVPILGAVTPLGGVLQISGWIVAGLSVLQLSLGRK